MKETSFKAGVIGGVFTFLALFATTSKASINESAATNGDYKINRVSRKRIRLYVNRMMSLLTCVNKLKGNDYAVDYLQATIR